MKTTTTLWVGMDVHKESISLSVLVNDREARPTVKFRNDALELKRFFGRLKKEGDVRACYEAGSLRVRGPPSARGDEDPL